jgi:hypothetical protein
MYSTVYLCPVDLGGSILGLAWLYRRKVFALYAETKDSTRKTEKKTGWKV